MLDYADFETEIDEFDGDLFLDEESDDLLGSATILGGAGAGLGTYLGGKAHDWWYKGKSGPQDSRAIFQGVGAGTVGSLGAGLGSLVPVFESDPFEPEYEAETVDEMEALLEEALEADGEDAEAAMDQMIARAFGMMRSASRIRQVMSAVRTKVRAIIARARRDPRYKAMARAVPIALRRTAAILLQRLSKRQPVTPEIALRVFAGVVAKMLRTPRTRSQVSRNSALRARRYRKARSAPRPRRRLHAY